MIIKSKYSYFILSVMIFQMVAVTFGILYYLSLSVRFQSLFLIPIFLVILILAVEFTKLYWDTKLFTIDTDKQTIVFRRILTGKESAYSFQDIDGIFENSSIWGSNWKYKVLYFVKDNKIVERISPVFIKNYDEVVLVLMPLISAKKMQQIDEQHKNFFYRVIKLFRNW